MPNNRSTRPSHVAPDRRFLNELDDLMERMWLERDSLYYWSDGKIEFDLYPVAEALLRHLDRVIESLNRGRHPNCAPLTPENLRTFLEETKQYVQAREEERQAHAGPSAPHTYVPPFSDEHRAVWQAATFLEQRSYLEQCYVMGTFFIYGSERSGRGPPLDENTIFRSQRIAAYTQFREWEGCRTKAAVADALARYNTSRSAVFAARKKWLPQMQHLKFDTVTAKAFRERLEWAEDNYQTDALWSK